LFFSTLLELVPTSPTLFDLVRHSSTIEFVEFHRFLLPLSSILRALLRPWPSLFELILPSSSFCDFRIREIQVIYELRRGVFHTG
jgi:hypothetical protein